MKEKYVWVRPRGRELWGIIVQQGALILGYLAVICVLVWAAYKVGAY